MSKKLSFLAIIILIQFASFSGSAHADTATVSWDANTEQDLLGYKIYFGTASRNYSQVIDVGNIGEFQISNLSRPIMILQNSHGFA